MEEAVIFGDSPGQPLVVLESNDSCKYFDINARVLNFCEGMTSYQVVPDAKDEKGKPLKYVEGTVMQRVNNTRVDLDKFQENSYSQTDYKFDKLRY